ncbi:MAG: hypothetical protein ACLFRV_00335 [Acidimicrobiales bacterium]
MTSAAPTEVRPRQHPQTAVLYLSGIVLALTIFAALVGLFWSPPEVGATFTSVRGEPVELYGEGLYRYDTAFKGGANRGADLVTLAIAVPALAIALHRYRRGSLQALLVAAGVLTWFLYLYASLALGTFYNELFLVYVALFSASLFALGLALRSIPPSVLTRLDDHAPRRGLVRLMLAGGAVTAIVWGSTLVGAAITGDPPKLLDHSTTMVTDALDLAIITPATLVCAYLLHHRRRDGWLFVLPLLSLLVMLFPMIAAQTAFQLEADVSFEPPEIIGPIAGFVAVAAIALPLLIRTVRAAGSLPRDVDGH